MGALLCDSVAAPCFQVRAAFNRALRAALLRPYYDPDVGTLSVPHPFTCPGLAAANFYLGHADSAQLQGCNFIITVSS